MSFNSHSSHAKKSDDLPAQRSAFRMLIALMVACFFTLGSSAEAQLDLTPRNQGSTAKSDDGSGSRSEGSGSKADGSGSKSNGSGSKSDGSGSKNGSGSKSDGSDSKNGLDSTPQNHDQLAAPPGKMFRVIIDRIKQNESEINQLFITMPIGFAEQQQKQIARIDKLKAENKFLVEKLPGAAIEAFKAAPGEDSAATQFVIQTLNELIEPKLPGSVFGPMSALKIVDTMLDAGATDDVVLLSKGFRASFALDDFDRASLMLDRIADVQPQFDLTATRELVDSTKEKWQRELGIRRLEINNDNLPKVRFKTSAGDFTVALYEDYAPNTVANFISLVEKKFYHDLTFHYVKPGEYIHTGCPNGDGSGGPGYSIASEFGREQTRYFFAGTLGMANTGPNTEGSQFVITHQPLPQLDDQFTAFGRVIKGFDVILNAKAIDPRTPLPANGGVTPEPITIIKAEVVWKRNHEYEPEKFKKQGMHDMNEGLDKPDSSDDIFAPRSASQDVPSLNGGGLFSPSNP